jgi:hypothetical protein
MTNDNAEPSAASGGSGAWDFLNGEIVRLRSKLQLQDAVIRSGATLALTDAEREAIEVAAHWCETPMDPVYSQTSLAALTAAKTLRGLLERLKSLHNTRIYGSEEGER